MRTTAFALIAAAAAPLPAAATVEVGSPAPAFRLADAAGRTVSLAAYRGRVTVLEWSNPGCPFVRKHYNSGNMQRTQAAAIRAGAVWLTINSSGPGKQGHLTGAAAKAEAARGRATAYLLDPQGKVGHAYDAKTTPHLFVVGASGRIVYAGGIDDRATADPGDIAVARNHVTAALGELKTGKPVSVATSRPYGCSIKYAGG